MSEKVGLELHQVIVGRRPAIDAQLRDSMAAILFHRDEHVMDLIGDAVERGADQIRTRGTPGEAEDCATGSAIPYGAPSPTNAGTKYGAVRSLLRAASALVSDELAINLSSSRSHCTAAPR